VGKAVLMPVYPCEHCLHELRSREELEQHPCDPGLPTMIYAALSNGKYTKWMAELSLGQLNGLLWLVGEFAARSSADEFPCDDKSYPGDRRKYGALAALARFRREPMTLDQVLAYIRSTVRPPAKEDDMPDPAIATDDLEDRQVRLAHRGAVSVHLVAYPAGVYLELRDGDALVYSELFDSVAKIASRL